MADRSRSDDAAVTKVVVEVVDRLSDRLADATSAVQKTGELESALTPRRSSTPTLAPGGPSLRMRRRGDNGARRGFQSVGDRDAGGDASVDASLPTTVPTWACLPDSDALDRPDSVAVHGGTVQNMRDSGRIRWLIDG